MRILIIALARSGGYQLNEWLALELGYKMIHEPIRRNASIEGDNIVVKYVLNEIEYSKDVDYTNWDKVIGLTREDIKECAISQSKAVQQNEWRKRYEVSDEWLNENDADINHFEEWIRNQIQFFNNIKEIELKVTYEGIYHTKEDIQRIKDYIGITNPKYEHLLDSTNRLRKTKGTKSKLI